MRNGDRFWIIIAYKATSKFGTQNVVFSKHALGQRGEQKVIRGKIISGQLFVCKIFETGDDFTIQIYHNSTCKVFNCAVTKSELRSWIMDDYLTAFASSSSSEEMSGKDAEGERQLRAQQDAPILRPENIRFLHQWLLDNLVVHIPILNFMTCRRFLILFHCSKIKYWFVILHNVWNNRSIWRENLMTSIFYSLKYWVHLRYNVAYI